MGLSIWLAVWACSAASDGSYLTRTIQTVEACRADIAGMQTPADEAAARLVKGGALWAAGNAAFVSELSGRAAGLMLVQGLGERVPAAGDVVIYGADADSALPVGLRYSGAQLIVIGATVTVDEAFNLKNHAEVGKISPTLANIIPAWLFTGELVAACTRAGRMPVVYETIGLPGGYPRITQYQGAPKFWHEDKTVPPVAAGVVGNQYADFVVRVLERVEREERDPIDTAAAWIREAKAAGHTAYLYTMGHFLPDEASKTALGTYFKTGVLNSGFTQQPLPEDVYQRGDVVVHVGYQHPPNGLFEKALPAGARVVYVDILQHRDYARDLNVVWIDPMWPWSDGAVSLEGYDVPVLPPSGVVNTAIMWEICLGAVGE